MKIVWKVGNIETIYDMEDEDLIYSFMSLCVSYSCGRKKWNEYATIKSLSDFVTPADEAFAMILLENNAAKWMDELYMPHANKKQWRKALYTETEQARRWSYRGKCRNFDLIQKIIMRRNEESWMDIEALVKRKEIEMKGIQHRGDKSGSKRKRAMNDNEMDILDNTNGDDDMEHNRMVDFMADMINGGNVYEVVKNEPSVESIEKVLM